MNKYKFDYKYTLLLIFVVIASLALPYVLHNTIYLRVTHEMEIVSTTCYGSDDGTLSGSIFETVLRDLSTGDCVSITGKDVFYAAVSATGERVSVSYTSVLFKGRCIDWRNPSCRLPWGEESFVVQGFDIYYNKAATEGSV